MTKLSLTSTLAGSKLKAELKLKSLLAKRFSKSNNTTLVDFSLKPLNYKPSVKDGREIMLPKTRKTRKYRRSGKSLIAAGFLNPQRWQNLSKSEIARALSSHLGLSVKEVKKVRHLKHQVCISYITIEGRKCSSFFSYRIFESWLKAVESLIYSCHSLKELYTLTRYIQYDLDYFPYLVEISDAIAQALDNRTCQLKLIAQAA